MLIFWVISDSKSQKLINKVKELLGWFTLQLTGSYFFHLCLLKSEKIDRTPWFFSCLCARSHTKNIHCSLLSFFFSNSLQTFLLDGNFLQTLPAELENMHQLSYLGLSFNEFTDIPELLEKLTAMDKLCMAGNCLETLSLQALRKMPHIKHVDLR